MADSPKTKKIRELLSEVSMDKTSLAELGNVTSPALRNAIVDLVSNPDLAASGHQNHGSHADHFTDSARFIDAGVINPGTIDPGVVPGGRGPVGDG